MFFVWGGDATVSLGGGGGYVCGTFLFLISTFKPGDSDVLGCKFACQLDFPNVARRERGILKTPFPFFFNLKNMFFLL